MKSKLLLFIALVSAGSLIIPNCNAGIICPMAPDGGEQAVSNVLNSRFLKPSARLPPVKDLTIARPFGVYYYATKYTNLFSGRLLSATKFCSWRFLLTDGTNSAALELGYDKTNGGWQEDAWCFYPACSKFSDPVLQTLQAAKRLPQVKKEDYELRYLNFLDLQFFAVWLHGKSNDIIIPVPVYGKWQDNRPYSEREIIRLLRREIEDEMKEPPYKGSGIPVD